jgi:hypothetical protein
MSDLEEMAVSCLFIPSKCCRPTSHLDHPSELIKPLSPQLKNAPTYEAVGGYYREDAIMLLRRFYLTENVYAPNPRSKAKRVLKTYFQPPGVSMHGPNGRQLKKSSQRRNGRTRSSTPGAGSDAGESGQ